MRRAAAPLLVLAVIGGALVIAWPRSSQDPGSAGDATTKDAGSAGKPRLATSPGGAKPAAPGPETAPSPSPMPYRFEVRDEAGPLADATIATTEGTSLGKTDADGRLSASLSAAETWNSIGVIARHAGYAPSYAPAQHDEVCRITMEKGAFVRGRVVLAPGDLPVEGARVVASVSGRTRLSLGETVTDGAGRFQVNDAPRGVPVDLVVRAAGHATATAHGKTEEEVLIRLEEGGILEGVVTDAGGQPLPNAVVYVLGPDDPVPPDAARGTARPTSWSDVDDVDRTTTDAAGRYEIAGVKPDKPRVAVALPTPMLFGRSEPVTFERAGERLRRDVVVPVAGALRVVVEGLARTEGAEELLALRGGGLEVQSSATQRSPDGSWEFSVLTPGRYEVRFFVLGSPFIGRHAEVEAGKTTEVRLSFPGGKTIEGRVTTEDGTGVPHATVWWTGAGSTVNTADEEGRFRFIGLDETPGTLVASSFRKEGLGRAVLDRVVPGKGGPVRLVLGPLAKIRARLPELAAETRVGFHIHARFGSVSGGRESVSAAGTLDVPVGVLGVPVEVILYVPKSAPLRLEVAALAAGEVRDVGEVRFEAGRTLLLRVVDADQAPVPAAGVQVDDPYVESVITDGKGEAALALMPRATFFVAVTAPHRPPYMFAVPAQTAGPVVLRLASEGSLEIRVTERDGSPAAAARVALLTAEENPYGHEPDPLTRDVKADAAGIWRERVQPRAYRLHVRSLTGEGETKATAVVRSGETTTVTVRLP